MRTGSHIIFALIKDNAKTSVWHIIGHGSIILGEIKWHCAWRRYCFFPANDTIWDLNCLDEVAMFIEDQMEAHKDKPNWKEVTE